LKGSFRTEFPMLVRHAPLAFHQVTVIGGASFSANAVETGSGTTVLQGTVTVGAEPGRRYWLASTRLANAARPANPGKWAGQVPGLAQKANNIHLVQ
jgi:hypothetical protein